MATIQELNDEFVENDAALEIISNMINEDETGAYWSSVTFRDDGSEVRDYSVSSEGIEELVRSSQNKIIEDLILEINSWNYEYIRVLKENLETLKDYLIEFNRMERVEDIIDLANLPSADIPDDIDTSYPVWAMDKSGMCLVGETLDDIERIDEIRASYV